MARLPDLRILPFALLLGFWGGCLLEVGIGEGDTGTTAGEVPTCGESGTLCDGECVDTTTDSEHCNGCGNRCVANTDCIGGSCLRLCIDDCDGETEVCGDSGVCECRAGFDTCDGLCVDLRSDPDHCGRCFDPCGPAEVCADGDCFAGECDAGTQECDNACVDTQVDPSHCGDCGRACPSDELCLAGDCVLGVVLDPEICAQCPCVAECGAFPCCFSDYLGAEVCVDAGSCEAP